MTTTLVIQMAIRTNCQQQKKTIVKENNREIIYVGTKFNNRHDGYKTVNPIVDYYLNLVLKLELSFIDASSDGKR